MVHPSYRTRLEIALLGLVLVLAGGGSITAEVQFIVVNVAPGRALEPVFEQVRRMTDEAAGDHFGLGIASIFSYLNQSREKTTADLKQFLALAERFEMPIVVQLDGEQWWAARPDLWNWWDPTRPGYDPRNRENVEWSGWGPEHAVKIAWRNWGRQIRVLPPPNFMSPSYRQACHEEMRVLVPLILQWWRDLPEDRRHLLVGIKLGWESSIGVNSFYYPDGNALQSRPESEDPRTGLKADQVPDRGVEAIGYAAVKTAQLTHSGQLREEHLVEVVRRHLEDLCGLASELGVPREKLFTHVAGWKDQEKLYDAALNQYSNPGWSFYKYSSDPARDKGVQRGLRKSDAPYWAAVEWLLMGNQDSRAWRDAIERTLSDPKCRFMCIYNWGGIKNNQAALDAIGGILDLREVKVLSDGSVPGV